MNIVNLVGDKLFNKHLSRCYAHLKQSGLYIIGYRQLQTKYENKKCKVQVKLQPPKREGSVSRIIGFAIKCLLAL